MLEPLASTPSQSQTYNQQIDKYPHEWIDEWKQDIQSEDAKWEEIAYIARDVNKQYGLSLAYYYLNQEKNVLKRREIKQKIK